MSGRVELQRLDNDVIVREETKKINRREVDKD